MARADDEFYYGFEPNEPEPIGICEICGDDVYNEDYIIEGDVVCPMCEMWYHSDEFLINFLMFHPGSTAAFLNEFRGQPWFPGFVESAREYFEEDLIRWIKEERHFLAEKYPSI